MSPWIQPFSIVLVHMCNIILGELNADIWRGYSRLPVLLHNIIQIEWRVNQKCEMWTEWEASWVMSWNTVEIEITSAARLHVLLWWLLQCISFAPIIILTTGYQLYRPKITVSAIGTKQIVMRLPLSLCTGGRWWFRKGVQIVPFHLDASDLGFCRMEDLSLRWKVWWEP